MTALSAFSMQEAELLISLPYKVGMWVSHAEDEEGEADDARETKALELCLKAVVKLHDSQPFIKEVAVATLNLKIEWPRWADQSFATLADVEKAISLLRGKSSADELRHYRAMLMEIAACVAHAYGEFGQFDNEDEGFFSKIAAKFSAFSLEDAGHPMNVGATEGSILADLAAALKAGD